MDSHEKPFEIIENLIPYDSEYEYQYPGAVLGRKLAFFSDGLYSNTELCAVRECFTEDNIEGELTNFLMASLDKTRSTVCIATISRQTTFDYLSTDEFTSNIFRNFLNISKLIQIDPSHSSFNVSMISYQDLSSDIPGPELND